jgi:hypothetical protein
MHDASFIVIKLVHDLVQPPGKLAFGNICRGAGIFICTLGPPSVRAASIAPSVSSLKIYVGIVGDFVEPGGKSAAAIEAAQRRLDFEKSLLGQVLRVLPAVAQTSQI